MIIFEFIRWKNFLSTGNTFTEVQLDENPTTLIVGENGAGKSTILDAICFSLYGKAFRNINKPILVNSVNGKNCLVEIQFSIGSKKYFIRRGIKPAIFDIFCNGILVDQDASGRDYQKYLEETILKINYRSFTQIVILGSASFTPFMQLPASHRREIIEDILDIKIFSDMNVLLKERISQMKQDILSCENQLEISKEKTLLQSKFIKNMEQSYEQRTKPTLDELARKSDEIEEYRKQSIRLDALIKSLSKKTVKEKELNDRLNEAHKKMGEWNRKKSSFESKIEFLQKNDNCPTCLQSIDKGHCRSEILSWDQKIQEVLVEMKILEEIIGGLEKELEEYIDASIELKKYEDELSKVTYRWKVTENYVKSLEDNLKKTQTGDKEELEKAKAELKSMAKRVVDFAATRAKLKDKKYYLDTCAQLLKDTGIKTTVIKQYIPIINKQINKYLSIMDFYVHFELDDSFNEIIKSRHRDIFSYSSFSEGEKQRINLALLFTWRHIAKLKNSVNTNLLLLDEIFDGSLDAQGVEYVTQLLRAFGDTNVFVISHKGDQLADKFHNQLRFEKNNNFSSVV